jgi:hypothetical protein
MLYISILKLFAIKLVFAKIFHFKSLNVIFCDQNFLTAALFPDTSSYVCSCVSVSPSVWGSQSKSNYFILKLYPGLRMDDMYKFMKRLFSRIFIQGMVYGNCDEKVS